MIYIYIYIYILSNLYDNTCKITSQTISLNPFSHEQTSNRKYSHQGKLIYAD